MNSNHSEPTTSDTAKRNCYPGIYIAAAILFAAVIFLWFDRSQTQSAQLAQIEQNEQLAQALEAAQSELAAAREELDFFKTGDTTAPAQKKPTTSKPAFTKPAEEPETLLLQTPTVSRSASGLTARFGFEPDTDIPLPDVVTLVIRVPSSSEATITSLKPLNESSYSNVEFLVNAKGNLGMIEGSPADLKALEFELTVSGPVKATVRGSKGIKAFEMDITPDGCTVRKL